MRNETFGGCRSANAYVAAKLKRFDSMERSFETLFQLMFSERENTLYEKSEGFRLVKTTYGEAYDRILRRAATLRALLPDLPADSVVGLYLDNCLDWIELFWAILRCGFRPLLMNLRLDDGTLEDALKSCSAAAVVSKEVRFSVRTVRTEEIVPAETPMAGGAFGSEILVMSSGTSLHVKLCAYSAEEFYHQIHDSYQIITGCRQMKKHYRGQLKHLTFLPFYHVFGLIAVYIWFAFFSRTFVELKDLAPQTILNTIRRHQVTHIFAVPLFWETVYAQALKTIRERGEDTWERFQRGMRIARKLQGVPLLGRLFGRVAFREMRENLFGESIRFLITGGSAIDPEVMAFFNAIGYHLADGYGMTEIGITSVELSRRKKTLNACFVGKPMSSIEYAVGDGGELLVRGAATARYILEDGKRTERDGWFHTRDLAEEVRGHYRILGRLDDLVVAPSGENLNPNLVERCFAGLEGVRGVCLIGAQTEGRTQPVLLVSVGRHAAAEQLRRTGEQVRAAVAAHSLTGQIGGLYFTEDDLMGPTDFKLNRTRLARDYAAGLLREAVPAATAEKAPDDGLRTQLRQMFAVALGKDPDAVRDGADFFLDEGGTSLDYFAMISQLQQEFSLPFPTESGKSMNSVDALYDYIRRQ